MSAWTSPDRSANYSPDALTVPGGGDELGDDWPSGRGEGRTTSISLKRWVGAS